MALRNADRSLSAEVCGSPYQSVRVIVKAPDTGIAIPAKQATNFLCRVVMVNMKPFRSLPITRIGGTADRASVILIGEHRCVVLKCDAVRRFKVRAYLEIRISRILRAFVSATSFCCPSRPLVGVGAIAATSARVSDAARFVFRESTAGLLFAAFGAFVHPSQYHINNAVGSRS